MDRVTLEQLLAEAESVVHRGERNIAHQREVIGTLERGGHDAAVAKSFLDDWKADKRGTLPAATAYAVEHKNPVLV
jgi:hypothetical protein